MKPRFTRIRNLLGRPSAYLRVEWERMAPRERRLVAALVGAIVGMVGLLGAYFVVDSLGAMAEHNVEVREALKAIAGHREEYLEAKARNTALEMRIGTEPPQLQADLEAAAREVGVQIPESNERPAAAAGRRYLEHNVDLKLRGVDLHSLSKFLRRLETGPRLILVTRLSTKRRYAETDKLDAELTVTGFERVREEKAAKTKKAPEAKSKP